MSTDSTASIFLDGLSRLGGQQWSLRLLVLVTPPLAVAVEAQAGAAVQRWFVVLVAVLSVVSALLPDSQIGLLVVLLVGWHWTTASAGGAMSLWILVLASILLLFHVACTLASYGPPSAVLDADLLALWLRRWVTCAAVAALVWVTARVASGLALPASGLVLGAALLLLVGAMVVLARAIARRA